MIPSQPRFETVVVDDPLPPSWLRLRATEPDATERVGARLLRVGPRRELLDELVNAIEHARDVVLVASFLLSHERLAKAMLGASERGVRVYVLTASEARLASAPRDDDAFTARMIEEHKALLDRLGGKVVLRSAAHFHAKLLVVDPHGPSPRGWICTANFNNALEESVELAWRVEGSEAKALAEWFSWAFWMEAEHELVAKGRLSGVGKPPAVPGRPVPASIVTTARDGRSLRDAVLELIRAARSELLVCSYGLEAEHEATAVILERARAGVSVTVFTRTRPAVADAVKRLADAGVMVVAHDKLHAKGIVSDGRGLLMTANLEAQGLDRGFEVGLLLDERGAEALRTTMLDWKGLFPWAFASAALPSSHLDEFCPVDLNPRTGMQRVVAEEVVRLDAVTAASALDLEGAPAPKLTIPKRKRDVPRRIRFEWNVQPPRLPRSAKERMREIEEQQATKDGKTKLVKRKVSYSPKVYDDQGRAYVLLERPEQRDDVAKLAAELGARVVVK